MKKGPGDKPRRLNSVYDNDYYITPPHATHALCCEVINDLDDISSRSVLEPAAGGGHMVDVLERYFSKVDGHDIADPEGRGWEIRNYITSPLPYDEYDWVITNPPYNLAMEFVSKAVGQAKIGVAMLCRFLFLEGQHRYYNLFSSNPPNRVSLFPDRVHMGKASINTKEKGSAICYAWFVWLTGNRDNATELKWIQPGSMYRYSHEFTLVK